MPSVTFDGRSFLLDGKRIWIVSGAIHMHRIPRVQWADRIHAAKLAGLNTIEVPLCWARHEPRPNNFDFEGENDLKHFVDLIGKAGMWCILRPGPYIGEGWDLGGIPPWVLEIPKVQLRSNNGPFLEACSRFLGAVTDRVRSMQVTSAGAGGPILLVQNESAWNCSHANIALGYLGELNRYLREGGITVPIINANSLWQNVEGEIDCWSGTEHMLPALRQLSFVRPDQPRIVVDFPLGEIPSVGSQDASSDFVRGGTEAPLDAWALQRRLAEITAGGGQFNLQPFAGGSTNGFLAGRLPLGPAVFAGRSYERGGAILESGAAGPSFHAIRRIATFASRFARVLSSLDQNFQPVALDTSTPRLDAKARSAKSPTDAGQVSVIHASGQQGGVVFLFAPDPSRTGAPPAPQSVTLLLSDGSTLPVAMGRQAVTWCLIDAPLGGRASLDYCNLCALGVVGKAFVCFGPAGAKGMLSINGSGIEVAVPTGKAPVIEEHEGIAVVVCNEDQVDTCFLADDAVYVGVSGLTAEGKPLALAGVRQATRIGADGSISQVTPEAVKPPLAADKVASTAWTQATLEDYVRGTSARFATIKGPGELTSLGAPYGYGWYKIAIKSSSTRKARLAFPHASDRVTAFIDGEPVETLGVGSGTSRHLTVNLKKPATEIVFLAANLGRFSEGDVLGDRKGIYGQAWEVETFKAGKPKLVTEDPVDILAFRAPLWEIREGDTTIPERITWTIAHRSKASLVMWLRGKDGRGFMGRALLMLDGKPIEVLEYGYPDQVLIDAEQLSKGNHTLAIALFPETLEEVYGGDVQAALKSLDEIVHFEEATEAITAKADWSFAKWEQPGPTHYAAPAKNGGGAPTWWKCTFEYAAGHPAVRVDLAGLSTGQVYVNGTHLGRYFLRKGQTERILVHTHLLKAGKVNDLVIFDEQGLSPKGVHLSYEGGASPIVARPH
ncbi:MAG TPA: beta-galactosidase [Phycisphaerales bacterium]|nr:beta-galactosidase [Phycisphaerales bacterium]